MVQDESGRELAPQEIMQQMFGSGTMQQMLSMTLRDKVEIIEQMLITTFELGAKIFLLEQLIESLNMYVQEEDIVEIEDLYPSFQECITTVKKDMDIQDRQDINPWIEGAKINAKATLKREKKYFLALLKKKREMLRKMRADGTLDLDATVHDGLAISHDSSVPDVERTFEEITENGDEEP